MTCMKSPSPPSRECTTYDEMGAEPMDVGGPQRSSTYPAPTCATVGAAGSLPGGEPPAAVVRPKEIWRPGMTAAFEFQAATRESPSLLPFLCSLRTAADGLKSLASQVSRRGVPLARTGRPPVFFLLFFEYAASRIICTVYKDSYCTCAWRPLTPWRSTWVCIELTQKVRCNLSLWFFWFPEGFNLINAK